jgi:hypothetical protein
VFRIQTAGLRQRIRVEPSYGAEPAIIGLDFGASVAMLFNSAHTPTSTLQ